MGMMGTKLHGAGRAAPEMNVTPLVDVVLVLLIIFMVITPLLTKQFWLHLPTPNHDETPVVNNGPPPVVVSVDAAGVMHLNRNVVTDTQLAGELRRVLANRGDRTVFFDADDAAPFEQASHAMDIARGAGASTIVVATERIGSR